MKCLEIEQGRLQEVAVKSSALPDLAEGAVRAQIYKFGLTSNNVTYAAMGHAFGWYKLFPTPTPDETMALPVWALATIVESNHPEIKTGVTIYGYFPAATHLDLVPTGVTEKSFTVTRALPLPVYNTYDFCASDPLYSAEFEDAMILVRPLFFTSFFLYDYVKSNNLFGAEAVVLSSASAKTAFCCAQLCSAASIPVIGLTSAKNLAFTKSLGVYDSVLTYDDLSELKNKTFVYIDIAGNMSVIETIVKTLPDSASQVVKTISVGFTHFHPTDKPTSVSAQQVEAIAPGLKFELFFAPLWRKKIAEEGRQEEVSKLIAAGWKQALAKLPEWMQFKKYYGADAVKELYLEAVEGKLNANVGYICTMDNTTHSE
ncbi:hypothetical protein BCR33DRAFT_712466 [Rhizoclosmatium globosum]|uniref:Uncharacterized protein n=1 Tax=Rhizoclosmatium globosum TaxID=329046 RepID=A0A1Y2CWI7_9FUNG|nr:hypothetical protein BCR33DRAFT_712466 [Rhizoclosmatium globosum]|eukprot:ORY51402.1 hypothetical protein BCR33DRAFT_712466 [Rhizoclosmatium globosum]